MTESLPVPHSPIFPSDHCRLCASKSVTCQSLIPFDGDGDNDDNNDETMRTMVVVDDLRCFCSLPQGYYQRRRSETMVAPELRAALQKPRLLAQYLYHKAGMDAV